MRLMLTFVTLVLAASLVPAAPEKPVEKTAPKPAKKPTAKLPGWECHGPWGGLVLAARVDPADPARVLLGTSRGWFLSTDAGENWSMVRDPGGPRSGVMPMAFHRERLVLAVRDGTLISRDGEAWSRAPAGPGEPMFLSVPPEGGRLWGCFVTAVRDGRRTVTVASFEGGEWRTSTSMSGEEKQRMWVSPHTEGIAVHPENPDVVRVFLPTFTAGRGTDVLATDDGGENWESYRIVARPYAAVFLFGGNGHGASNRLLMAAREEGAGSALLRSEDGGRTWTAASEDPRVRLLRTVTRVPGSPRVWIGTQESGLLHTDDGGATLVAVGDGIRNECVASVGLAKGDAKLVFAGTQWGVFRSRDGGAGWTDVTEGVAAGQNQGPFVVAGPPARVLMFGWMCGMRSSADGGRSWSDLDPGFYDRLGRFFRVRRAGRTILGTSWRPGGTALWVSRDAGGSWTRTDVEEGQALAVLSESEMYATPDGRELMRSETGGIWTSLGKPLLDPNDRLAWAAGRPDGDVLVVGGHRMLARLDRKTGEVRGTLGLPTEGGRKLCLLDPVDDGILYVSSPGEETWQGDPATGKWTMMPGGRGYLMAVVVDPGRSERRIAAYEYGALRLSDDGGKTWRPLTPNPGFRFLRGLDVTPDGFLLAGADGAVHRIPLASIR